MNFLVDANLPPGLAVWLRARGYHASHVAEAPGLRADDAEIMAYARGGRSDRHQRRGFRRRRRAPERPGTCRLAAAR
ncbi:MAG: DUF5615 family PIN-like protein [Pseudomonadota bacterium]